MDRRLLIAATVLVLHLLALWALHAGLLHRPVEQVIPVQVLAELIEPPQPAPEPAPPTPAPPEPAQRQQQPKTSPKPPPRPQAVAVAPATPDPAPSPSPATPGPAPVSPAATPTDTAPLAVELAAPAPPAPPAPPRIDLPSSSADYLNNPPPPYPPLSKRLGEQGQVVVRARIEVNGTASQVEIRTSSGFERLDRAALETVKGWRYVPGKRGGVAEAMWFNIPIRFVLD
ncbi:energy transducer TonB [Hydrogenophaga sp.]|uniref:energy transducer TonB n=1 Tax=Hydrogenophaga sp. TaxID=1904254 RepID=UPI00261ABB57|nr:energy transducer TonB [Hydrogenophaga sp.]MDM7949621.1 TonB family protein [Hydrogenophaga sp.]